MKDKTKPGFIYKVILDIPEPHVVYIGTTTQTPGERLSHHAAPMRRPTRLNKLINSLGKEHFSIEIIEWVDDYDERYAREHYWTALYKGEPDNCNECIGTKHSEEMRERDSVTSYRNREVVCENDQKHYRSCMQASIAYGLNCSDVSECCARHLRQVKGYFFRYADEDLKLYHAYWESGEKHRNLKVRCIETGTLYDNTRDAAASLGVRLDVVTGACRKGAMLRKQKVHLEYIKPYAVLPSHA